MGLGAPGGHDSSSTRRAGSSPPWPAAMMRTAIGKIRLHEGAEQVVRLYEAWGKPEEATAWKARLGLTDLPADVFARP